jgi:hypothetical protein
LVRDRSVPPSVVPNDDLHKCTLERQLQGIKYFGGYDFQRLTLTSLEPYIQDKTLLEDEDVALVAKLIMMVISKTTAPNYYYTCSTDQQGISLYPGDERFLRTDEADQEVLYDFYLKELLIMFATEKAVDGGHSLEEGGEWSWLKPSKGEVSFSR